MKTTAPITITQILPSLLHLSELTLSLLHTVHSHGALEFRRGLDTKIRRGDFPRFPARYPPLSRPFPAKPGRVGRRASFWRPLRLSRHFTAKPRQVRCRVRGNYCDVSVFASSAAFGG
ncbi:uncharacterized protein LOC126628022 [Malus sylvestris]|uniref:uncharacterized protein LOC126628022 n=1 Tax=Malus sylvestris TaxID=3752 RepID=UPI0021ACD86C|nr:uncharacterized protein LOC126628022 [Malus sylvestris]XP_050153558.1 uncharacterized protein LOC126628022 [Malus sylvestris]